MFGLIVYLDLDVHRVMRVGQQSRTLDGLYDRIFCSTGEISIQQSVQAAVVQVIRGHVVHPFLGVPKNRGASRCFEDPNTTFGTDSGRLRRLPHARAALRTNVET